MWAAHLGNTPVSDLFHAQYFMAIPRAGLLKLISVLLEQDFLQQIPWILLNADSNSVGLG